MPDIAIYGRHTVSCYCNAFPDIVLGGPRVVDVNTKICKRVNVNVISHGHIAARWEGVGSLGLQQVDLETKGNWLHGSLSRASISRESISVRRVTSSPDQQKVYSYDCC